MAEKKDPKKDDMFELQSAVRLLTAAIKDLIDGTNANTSAAEKENKERAKAREEAEKTAESTNKLGKEFDKLKEVSKKLGSELLKITDAGVKFASTVGTTATKGVELEIRNRAAVASQLLNFNANLAVTIEQLKSAQTGFSDVFIGAAEGMQLSAEGSKKFASDLKKGFGSEFEATPDTFRAMIEMGMSNVAQMSEFRKATGRAGLTAGQLTTLYNQNRLSFLLYGNSFAKAAVEAQRLGINLASIQGAQESLVTNLDGTIDTVAQINQLGGQIDFGNLIQLSEMGSPDELLRYVRATVPEQMMQSASTRALFKQLGISVEDYMKSGAKQVSAADKLEAKMTEQASKTEEVTNTLGALGAMASRVNAILQGSFGTLAMSAIAAAVSLTKVAAAGGLGGLLDKVKGMSTLSRVGMGLTGAGIGVSGAMAGRSLVEQGYKKTGMGLGFLGGAAGATLLALALAPATGGLSLAAIAGAGGLAGLGYAGMGKSPTPANDMFSAGYGSRMLVTPNGAFALNNADDIIAGTNLFPEGTLQTGTNNSDLIRKIDRLVDILSNANTVVNINGTMQTVPRMNLVSVYSRNELV